MWPSVGSWGPAGARLDRRSGEAGAGKPPPLVEAADGQDATNAARVVRRELVMHTGVTPRLQAVTMGVLAFALVLGAGLEAQPAGYESRSIDGTHNNLTFLDYGKAGIPLLRVASHAYPDGYTEPAGRGRKSPREISNLLAAQAESILNGARASDFVWQWGQFLDHDIDLTPTVVPPEVLDIIVPEGDPYFDPDAQGGKIIPFSRSVYIGGDGPDSPREQVNLITAFIDASNVYGSDEERAAALRLFKSGKLLTSTGRPGTGTLKHGHGRFLPFNDQGLPNAGGPDPSLFLAGDIRANEQIALTAMHTLFVREHNRLCDRILAEHPGMSDEEVYQRARKIVGAQMQVITYREFLPLLLGPDAIPPYTGYDDSVNPGIANEFATAAFRYGHSQLSPTLLRVNKRGMVKERKSVALKDAFFNPALVTEDGGITSLLHGLATQQAQEVDTRIVDGVRNFLFGEPGEGGFDLAALNIQRGRDHGLADYNSVRLAYGLAPATSFADITSDTHVQAGLAAAYATVDDMDLWVAGLAEDHLPGALVGETFYAILKDQFIRLRDGDRFWYENDPFFVSHHSLLLQVQQTTLADIIRRNTSLGEELQDNVLLVTGEGMPSGPELDN